MKTNKPESKKFTSLFTPEQFTRLEALATIMNIKKGRVLAELVDRYCIDIISDEDTPPMKMLVPIDLDNMHVCCPFCSTCVEVGETQIGGIVVNADSMCVHAAHDFVLDDDESFLQFERK